MQLKKPLLLVILYIFSEFTFSQDIYKPNINYNQEFSTETISGSPKGFNFQKFGVGIKGGVNFSLIIPLTRNSIFSGQAENYNKDYDFFIKNVGSQFGFILKYSFSKYIKLSLQPSLNTYSYKYNSEFEWQGNTDLNYSIDYNHKFKVFEIPLIIGYYMSAKQWQPYLQGGIYYGILTNSGLSSEITETYGNQTVISNNNVSSNSIYNKNQFGIIGGVGIRYAAGKTMIGIETNYRFLMSKLSSTSSRYANNQVTGSYDVTDNLLFNNLAISINITVPLVCKDDSKGPFMFCDNQ